MVQALAWQPYRQVDGEYTEFITKKDLRARSSQMSRGERECVGD